MKKAARIALYSIVSIHAFAHAEESVIIDQPGSPLQITSYSANYSDDGRYSREGVRHQVALKNISDKTVVAYRVSFNAFDAFNESMGRGLGGISIETIQPGGTANGSWVQTPYAAFKFEGYGTGVAYVSAVRLKDGTIWTFNQDDVLAELKKISDDLTADIFVDDENP